MTIDYAEALNKRIEALNKKKELNVQRVAKNSGISKNTIYSVLGGRSKNPSLNTLKAISDGFEIPLSDFLDFYPFNVVTVKDQKDTELEKQIIELKKKLSELENSMTKKD